jgi:hypothetical protein
LVSGAYVLSRNALVDMYYSSYYTRMFRFDDIWLGLIAQKADLDPFHCEEFHFYRQGCGSALISGSGSALISGSGSAWIRINLSCWIRIQEGKNYPQKKNKVKKFHVLNCWVFSFEG